MKKKGMYVVFAALLVFIALTVFAACKKDDGKTDEKITVTLNQSELALDRFEDGTLSATVEGTTDAVVWTTSNADVASVSDGFVVAAGTGTANITASAGGESAVCVVTVTDSGKVPLIILDTKARTLDENKTDQINARADYKDNKGIAASFTYSSDKPEVASVSESGLITAKPCTVGANTATITVGAQYRGYTLTSKSFTVTVVEPLSLSFSESKISIAASEPVGTDHVSSGTVTYTLLADDEPVTDQTELNKIEYVNADEGVAVYDPLTGTVTAVTSGETRITATYTSTRGTVKTAWFDIEVYVPVVEKAAYGFNLDLNQDTVTATLDASLSGIIVGVTDVATDKNVFTSLSGATVTFNKANLTAGERTYDIDCGDVIYRTDVIVATILISDTDSLAAFFTKMATDGNHADTNYVLFGANDYYLVANSFSSKGKTFTDWNNTYNGTFAGTFNGGGQAIYDLTLPMRGMMRNVGGVVKDLALIDAVYSSTLNGGFITNELREGGVVENVFVSGKMTSAIAGSNNNFGGIANVVYSGASVKNCVVVADFSAHNGPKGGIVRDLRGGGTVQNSFAVSDSVEKLAYSGSASGGGLYDTVHALKLAAEGNAALLEGFTAAFWNTESSFPIPEVYLEGFTTITLTAPLKMAIGDSATVIADRAPYVIYSISGTGSEHAVINEVTGELTVGVDAVNGTTIVVKATSIFDAAVYDEQSVEIAAPLKDHTDAGVVAELLKSNGIGTLSNRILFADINEIIEGTVAESDIITVSINGTGVEFNADATGITVARTNVSSTLKGIVSLEIETTAYVYKFEVRILLAAIGSQTELTAYFTAYSGSGSGAQHVGEYIVLTQSFTLANYVHPDQNGPRFGGTFDGRGYTITGFNGGAASAGTAAGNKRGMFRIMHVGSVIKNLALLDATYYGNNDGGIIANECYGSVENCFVQGEVYFSGTGNSGGIVNLFGSNVTEAQVMQNNIAVIDFITGNGSTNRGTNAAKIDRANPVMKNSYGISTQYTGEVDGVSQSYAVNFQLTNSAKAPVGCGSYKSIAAFGAAIEAGSVSFATANGWASHWRVDTENDKLYFKDTEVLTWYVPPGVYDYTGTEYESVGDLLKTDGIGTLSNGIALSAINAVIEEDALTDADIDEVSVAGEAVEFSVASSVITIAKTEIASTVKGVQTLEIVTTGGETFKLNVTVVLAAISKQSELTAYFTAYSVLAGSTTTGNSSIHAGETVILTANIDCTDYTHPAQVPGVSPYHQFAGTFDGRGFAIENLTYTGAQQQGFFRVIAAAGTVKNVAFVNVDTQSTAWGGIICAQNNGKINNIFVGGVSKVNGTLDTGGIIGRITNVASVTENCFVAMEYTGASTMKGLIVGKHNNAAASSTIRNCYGINSAGIDMIHIDGTHSLPSTYVNNPSAFASAVAFGAAVEGGTATLSAANGWASYWRVDATAKKLYFGQTVVLDWNA